MFNKYINSGCNCYIALPSPVCIEANRVMLCGYLKENVRIQHLEVFSIYFIFDAY